MAILVKIAKIRSTSNGCRIAGTVSADRVRTEPSPYRTIPYRTVSVPDRTVPCPYRTVPYRVRTGPYRTVSVAYQTVAYRTGPDRTVPYRFPRGTVLVDRTAYRTFLTVFRDFCFKKGEL
jgi:hypothetical protein